MPNSTLTLFHSFGEAAAEKQHDLGGDQLRVALLAEANAPDKAANTLLADLTEIDYANLSPRDIATTSSSQAGGVYKLVLADLVLTASGAVGPFRYVVIYNSVNNRLIGFLDYGSDVTLQAGEDLTLNFDETNGVLQRTQTPA